MPFLFMSRRHGEIKILKMIQNTWEAGQLSVIGRGKSLGEAPCSREELPDANHSFV